MFCIKVLESPDNYEVIFAKALGRGKASGETISWGESIVSQVFSTHKITIQEFNPVEFPDRLDHPFVIGFPIEIKPDIFYTLMIIRFGGPSFTNEVQSLIELFAQHIKSDSCKKRVYLDKIT